MSLHCVRGCSRINADGNREPVLANHGRLCSHCASKLEQWLIEIPDRYALVPQFLLPSADLDASPETKHTKRPTAPVPVRLAALDLLDTRLGRKWQGTEPTPDRRGTLGVLLAIANEIREDNGSRRRATSTVIHEADTIRGQLDWLTRQEWVTDAYEELRILHRELGDATGQHPARPVGTCGRIRPNTDQPCGGNIYPTDEGGAKCRRCNASWDYDRLRFLGTLLEDEPA